ncbi:MAG: tetratricopeptide repeat protein [Iphinoe sp. HA4291-MV1]|jgi:tetratricopeptide (TPR) repeat protein|nr:tetratricopeptide repeat protein [Iphinoe sp. HA4291-MV1]
METSEPYPQSILVNSEENQTEFVQTNQELLDDEENQDAYDDLIVSIEAKEQGLNLLIGVCDDANFRDRIISQYEAELQPRFRPYQVTLARGEPSLKAAINQLVEKEEYLRQCNPAVITVTGVEQLYFLRLGEERSEQEKFFGYLQWTREALREFPYAIVLWVTNQILVNLSQKAPDFWSWRNGVFRFVSKKTNAVPGKEIEPIRFAFSDELADTDKDNPYFLPIEDLQKLIDKIEQERGVKDASLATLYSRLGQIYRIRLEQGEAQNYKKEQDLAIKYLRKAVELQKELDLHRELATSLNNLAYLHFSQGRYTEAEPLYQQALQLTRRLLGEEHPHVASSLNNLAGLYRYQGRYAEAEPLYQQALELRRRLQGEEHPSVATSLDNLALLYFFQGRHTEAEPLYQQALNICERLLGTNHPHTVTVRKNLEGLRAAIHSYG